jgi:hypothetical protein
MRKIPSALQTQFEASLLHRAVPQNALASPQKIPLTPFTKEEPKAGKIAFLERHSGSLLAFSINWGKRGKRRRDLALIP